MTINLFWIVGLLGLLNIRMFGMMFWDKYIAQANAKNPIKKRRIPERKLLWNAAFFAAVGAILGMFVFRHKTRKNYFAFSFALFLLLQTALLYVGRQFLEEEMGWSFVLESIW